MGRKGRRTGWVKFVILGLLVFLGSTFGIRSMVEAQPESCPDESTVGLYQAPERPGCTALSSVTGSNVNWAEDFVIENPATVVRIVWWGGDYEGPPALNNDTFKIIIHEDDSGFPGTNIYSLTGISPTERIELAYGYYLYKLDLPNPPELSPGRYWIEIVGEYLGEAFLWQCGNLDSEHGVAGSVVQVNENAWNYSASVIQSLALQVCLGSPTPVKETPVPTVTQWGMLILLVLVCVAGVPYLRKRKSAEK